MATRTTQHTWASPDGRQWTVTLTWRDYECVGFAVEAVTADPASRITAVLVRSVPIGKFMAEARQHMTANGDATGSEPPVVTGSDRKRPNEHYHEVANVYFWAWVHGTPPLEAIMSRFHVSHSTAARWVREARARTILGPAQHGRAGGYPRWIDPEPKEDT